MLTPKRIADGVSQGRKIKLVRYIKETNNKRIKRGISDIVINLNWDWMDLQEKSLEKLKQLKNNPQVINGIRSHLKNKGLDDSIEVINQAFDEMMNSVIESLNSPYDPQKENKPNYIYHGNNVKENKDTGEIYFLGIKYLEIETTPAEYKETKSAPKSVVKQILRDQLPNNIKQYKIKREELAKVTLI